MRSVVVAARTSGEQGGAFDHIGGEEQASFCEYRLEGEEHCKVQVRMFRCKPACYP